MTSGLTLTLRASAVSHEGRVRANNEDAYCARDGVYVVADGMGGHQAGEVASALAVEALLNGRPGLTDISDLTALVGQANAAILARAEQEPDHRGMGTTLTGVVVVGDLDGPVDRVAAVNVGDSRTYRWRDGALEQITTDHSYVQDLVASGMLTAAEARHHPRRNIVTRALGVEAVVAPDVTEVEIRAGDRFLVCSDGLVDEVPDVDIADIMANTSEGDDLAKQLVETALIYGGRDNVTVIIVDVVPVAPVPEPESVAPAVEPPTTASPEPVPTPPATIAPKRRRVLGIALFVVGLIVVVGGTLVAVGAYARSGYYVDFDEGDDVVVVYRGKPGGVLWFDPTTVEVTDLRREALGPVDIERIAGQPTFGARSDVTLYLTTVTTTTTTTTTTVPR